MLAFPKPAKPVRGTAEARRYMADVARLPCAVCLRPSEVVHHVIHGRGAQRRASDFDTIGLCVTHHDELHREPDRWKARYGLDTDHIASTRKAVEQLRQRTIGGRQ